MFQFPNLFPRYSDPRASTAIKVEDGPEAGKDKDKDATETLNTVAPDGSIVKPEASGAGGANGANGAAGADADTDVKPDIKPDVKPNTAARAAQQKALVRGPMEGQVGKLVVMKSGKVKMIMGDDIVMNVRLSPIKHQALVNLPGAPACVGRLSVYPQHPHSNPPPYYRPLDH
jgi:hypothetical protein